MIWLGLLALAVAGTCYVAVIRGREYATTDPKLAADLRALLIAANIILIVALSLIGLAVVLWFIDALISPVDQVLNGFESP